MRSALVFFLLACTATRTSSGEIQAEEPMGGEYAQTDVVVGAHVTAPQPEEEPLALETVPEPILREQPTDLVVFLAVRRPSAANQAALVEALRAENILAEAEGSGEVVLLIAHERFLQYFRAQVGTSRTGASSSGRMITVQTLDQYRIPRGLRRLVESVYFDPQR